MIAESCMAHVCRRMVERLLLVAVCAVTATNSAWAGDDLVAKGREIFFNETFDGNGRTCGTCHPANNNFTIDPAFIATLPMTIHCSWRSLFQPLAQISKTLN